MRKVLCGIFCGIVLAAGSAVPGDAAPLTQAQINGWINNIDPYAVVDVAPSTTTFSWNTGPIAGNVLAGNGVGLSISGGDNGGVASGKKVYYDSTLSPTPFASLQNPPTTSEVSTCETYATSSCSAFANNGYLDARDSAKAVSDWAASLTATSTVSTIGNGAITGNGGQNVIDVTGTGNSINNAAITLCGTASDFFVFNVSSDMHENVAMALNTGGTCAAGKTAVSASNILWNFTATSGTVFQTSGGGVVYGTVLATDGGAVDFEGATLYGSLVETDANLTIVSNAVLPTDYSFNLQSAAPEPSTWMLFASGGSLLGLGLLRRNRKRTGQANRRS